MFETALIVAVPEAEVCVGGLRARFDASSRLGVPAHITILAPFMPPQRISPQVSACLARVIGDMPAFEFVLSTPGRFAATTYLAPEPAAPFIALTEAVVRHFPGYPPFGGRHHDIVPHLTVAHGSAADAVLAEDMLRRRLRALGPVRSTCSTATLLENSTGVWKPMSFLALGAGRT